MTFPADDEHLDAAPERTPVPVDVPVAVRWTDLDAYGHVNNAAMVRLLEEARVAAFWQPPAEQLALGAPAPAAPLPVSGAGSALSTVIASQRIEYARSLGHRRDGVVVRLWLSRIGGASLSVDYLVLTRDDPDGTAPYARARTVVVMVDAADGTPVRLGADVRERLAHVTGEPLRFRD
ncbi:acyl-CoA thioesterase [Brachybacterium saurashtrense]|uniref:Acyl-CoA thioesterase n=1 Tax=Brachybacterium saurashtrense TaxID=556288 RepID=A0A345YLA2_9MICO|nr:thioesterase family protein [Brachybacterium saurashtrense]AXK44704.1 acyl-CoA thioesterase [Brachybacterium saurashtrense]RRR23316.1 acyl-CoA thioesterase [Brachybacterium saurashtrense]